jgi:hypothetical protein
MIELLKSFSAGTMFEGAIHRRGGWVRCLFVFFCVLTVNGCSSGQRGGERRISQEEGRLVFGASGGAGTEGGGQQTALDGSTGGWGIMLEHFTGVGHADRAARRAEELGPLMGRQDLRVIRKREGAAVVAGLYAGPGDGAAIRDLERVHAFTHNGRRPFARAFLAPPPSVTDPGELPELSLASARRRYGSRAEYTLQIGVYESSSRGEAKRAAEQAALTLRSEGELAFYHHGQRRSMVTIGVFGPQDYDDARGIQNPQLLSLKDRYPLNLLNGQFPILVSHSGGRQNKQRSMLVRIPE